MKLPYVPGSGGGKQTHGKTFLGGRLFGGQKEVCPLILVDGLTIHDPIQSRVVSRCQSCWMNLKVTVPMARFSASRFLPRTRT